MHTYRIRDRDKKERMKRDREKEMDISSSTLCKTNSASGEKYGQDHILHTLFVIAESELFIFLKFLIFSSLT